METFHVLKGENQIMLSAPHAVAHFRHNGIKCAESQTRSILEYVCEAGKCHGIYSVNSDAGDANWDKNCAYKEFLTNYIRQNGIKFLLDLHQMSKPRKECVCIGINGGKNILHNTVPLDFLISCFEAYGFKTSIDKPFPAAYLYTVSATVSRENIIPAFQIEVNSKYLYERNEEFRLNEICNAILDFTRYLESL